MAVMRLHRLFGLLAAILMTATLLAPAAGAEPPFRLPDTITDNAGVLSDRQLADVQKPLTSSTTNVACGCGWCSSTPSPPRARSAGPNKPALSAI